VTSGTKPNGTARHWQPGQLLNSSRQENLLTDTVCLEGQRRKKGVWRGEGRISVSAFFPGVQRLDVYEFKSLFKRWELNSPGNASVAF